MNNKMKFQITALLAGMGLSLIASSAFSASSVCEQRVNDTTKKIQECMTVDGLVDHLKAFQQFADENKDLPGTRFIGTSGYDASRDYVVNKLTNAGYKVTLQDVPVEISMVTSPNLFEQTIPESKIYADTKDYTPYIGSGSGDVTANVQIPSGDIMGCKPGDFDGFAAGNIALIQRGGTCTTQDRVINASGAGAKAVIIFDETTPGILFVGMGSPKFSRNIPVLYVSLAVGRELKDEFLKGSSPVVHINFNSVTKTVHTQNIIAESQQGDPDHVVMVGSHLDSSNGSAGMNDNASASSAVLETALLMQKVNPKNKLRFAWWTGEEMGLLGSNYYVDHLSSEEKSKISLYLNYEILGAPNGARLIMGTAEGVTPPGSEKITQFYVDYFNSQGLKSYVFDPRMGSASIRSDMYGFMKAGIPVGYLVTGAEIPWNPMFDAIFTDLSPRVAGLATHPCYHQTCDKLTLSGGKLQDANFDFDLYLQMSKAAAYAIFSSAMSSK